MNTDAATRGVAYDLGDLITAIFRNQQYDCRVDIIGVTVGSGTSSSTAKVRYTN